MKQLIAFSTVKDIFQILNWEYPKDYWLLHDESTEYGKHYRSLWDAGFNLDDWDGGFASKETLAVWKNELTDEDVKIPQHHSYSDTWDTKGDNIGVYQAWDESVEWLGRQMENYCVGYNYCFFGGWHWYTVHHS